MDNKRNDHVIEVRDGQSIEVQDGRSIEVQDGDGRSIEILDGQSEEIRKLVTEFNEILLDQKLEPPPSHQCCIYRVPEKIRKGKEEAYTPHLVSIGPFHHDNKELKSMDQVKKRFMKRLIQRSGNCALKSCIEFVKDWEGRIRDCYSERFEMNSDEFVKMILVDGCFIVELLLNSYHKKCIDVDLHPLLSVPWVFSTITLDLILLENQIPSFVLQRLLYLATAATFQSCSLLDLSLHFFEDFNKHKEKPKCESVKHFTDLVLTLYKPSAQSLSQRRDKGLPCIFSSTELDQAGVTFKCSSSKSLFDISFTNWVLQIPSFTLDDNTETHIRNIMALELCHYPNDSCVTDYMVFMDRLINTTRDVYLLVNKKIIENCLGDNKAVAELFNNLCTNVTFDDVNFYFSQVCKDLKAYYEVPWHSWKAMLKRNYFCTPWRTASTIAAVTLLVLTFIQTVLSLIP